MNHQVRKNIIQQRQTLSSTLLQDKSQQVFKHLQNLPEFTLSKKVGSYLAVNGEMETSTIHNWLHTHSKVIYLPIIKEDTLVFGLWKQNTKLTPNKFNILEPSDKHSCPIDQLDIILVPLVAFKADCNRMGMGGGYYDKTLGAIKKEKRPLLIGIAHEFQKNEEFTVNDWDIPLDKIITEKNIYCKKSL